MFLRSFAFGSRTVSANRAVPKNLRSLNTARSGPRRRLPAVKMSQSIEGVEALIFDCDGTVVDTMPHFFSENMQVGGPFSFFIAQKLFRNSKMKCIVFTAVARNAESFEIVNHFLLLSMKQQLIQVCKLHGLQLTRKKFYSLAGMPITDIYKLLGEEQGGF